MENKVLHHKKRMDLAIKIAIYIVSSIAIIALFAMVGFILTNSIPAMKGKGFYNIYFTSDIKNFGIWGALLVSLLSSFTAVLIALPISKRIAVAIRYRFKKFSRTLRVIIDILAGVPSIIFGLFAINSLGYVTGFLGGTSSKLTIFNATLMLSIMIIPTMVSLITNQLYLVNNNLIESSIALGNTKTKAVYSVALKSIKPAIYIAIITALGRAFGKTIATSMVLNSLTPTNIFKNGLGFINEGYMSLASSIASFMFTDSENPLVVQSAFAMGISMFVVIMILVSIVTVISSKNKIKIRKIFNRKDAKKIILDILYLPIFLIYFLLKVLKKCWDFIIYILILPIRKITQLISKKLTKNDSTKLNVFVSKIHLYWVLFWEVFSVLIVVVVISWILMDLLIIGAPAFNDIDFIPSKNGVSNALLWTLLLVLVSIIISFPLALFSAIFLSEYAKHKWFGKVVKFFLDSLGGTPSILIGIFGMLIFIDYMHIVSSATTSLMAGSLTMVLVILPTFTRSIEQVITNIPNELRESSYALGSSKWDMIRKIILPLSISGIVSGTIISMSRIISETAPVFLTFGMSFNPNYSLMGHGQTLTTWILSNQIYGTDNEVIRIANSYKYALVTVIVITLLIIVSYSIEPIVNKIKKWKKSRIKKRIFYE